MRAGFRGAAGRVATGAAGRWPVPELVARAKQVLRATTGYPVAAPAAMAAELEAQQWSVEQPYFAETIRALRARIGSPDFVQAAATAAWSDDAHAAARREGFKAKRELFLSLFAEFGRPASGEAGLYLWVDVRAGASGDDEAYATRLAEATGVVVQPGSYSGPGGKGFVRVALSPLMSDCQHAVDAWRAFERGER